MEYFFGTKKSTMDSLSSNQKSKLPVFTHIQNNDQEILENKDTLLPKRVKTIINLMKENKIIIIKPLSSSSIWTIEKSILTIKSNGTVQSYMVFTTNDEHVLFYMTTGHTFKLSYNEQTNNICVHDGTNNGSFTYELQND